MFNLLRPSSIGCRLRHALLSAGLIGIAVLTPQVSAEPLLRADPERPQNLRPLTRPVESTAESPDAAAAAVPDRSSTGSLLTTCGALGLVVMLVLGLARAWKQRGGVASGGLNDAVFEILGTRRLTVKQSIQLVRVGSRILVLGLSESGIETLSEITDPQEVEHLADACRATKTDSAGRPLRAMYDQFVRQNGSPGSNATSTSATPRRVSEFEETHRA